MEQVGIVTRVLDGIASAIIGLASVMMVVLIVIFSWLVYGRYILNATPTWVEQVALLLVVWIVFLGAAVGIRRRTHLSVDFIREAMPRPVEVTLEYIAIIAMLFFGVVMAWQGYVMFESTVRREIPLLGISEGWRAVPVSLSGALIAVFCVDEIYTKIFRGRT